MRSLWSDSKGSALSWLTVILILFVTGVITIICYYVLDVYIDEMTDAGYVVGPAVGAAAGFLWGLRIIDYVIILLMIILIVGVAITSYTIASKKVFFLVTFFMSAFYGLISYYFNYVFQEFAANSVLSATAALFPNTVLICTNLHWVMLANIIIGSIATYAKEEKGQYIQ